MRIVWTARALKDLGSVREFIAQDNPKAAMEVAGHIRETVKILAVTPGAGRPGRLPETRELLIRGTPYFIPYRVDSARKTVELLRVMHFARQWP